MPAPHLERPDGRVGVRIAQPLRFGVAVRIPVAVGLRERGTIHGAQPQPLARAVAEPQRLGQPLAHGGAEPEREPDALAVGEPGADPLTPDPVSTDTGSARRIHPLALRGPGGNVRPGG